MLLSIVTLSALVEVQLRVVLVPCMIVVGDAVRVIVGGKTTFTLALAVTVPPGPVAVAV
jgi:hypothetical protein